jgi:hypothetical protein
MLLAKKGELKDLFDHLEQQTYLNAKAAEKAQNAKFTVTLTHTSTTPEPFNLTPPKPKPLPTVSEEVHFEPHVARSAPKWLEGPTKEELAILEAKCAFVHVSGTKIIRKPSFISLADNAVLECKCGQIDRNWRKLLCARGDGRSGHRGSRP